MRSLWGVTPRQSVEVACAELGTAAVVAGCVALLGGGDADAGLVAALGGPRAPRFLDAPAGQRYWLRVWGARGLLWAPWDAGAATDTGPTTAAASDGAGTADDGVTAAIVSALADEHWRVREMAVRVVARHRLDAAQPAVAGLLSDQTARVRVAASRALRLLAT